MQSPCHLRDLPRVERHGTIAVEHLFYCWGTMPFLRGSASRRYLQIWGAVEEEREEMAVDVYFRKDILNVLRATYVASEGPATLVAELLEDPELRNVSLDKLLQIYQRGFNTALGAIGLAFGLDSYSQEGEQQAENELIEVRRGHLLRGSRYGKASSGSIVGSNSEEFDLVSFLWARTEYEKHQR